MAGPAVAVVVLVVGVVAALVRWRRPAGVTATGQPRRPGGHLAPSPPSPGRHPLPFAPGQSQGATQAA